ncbi:MAG: sigma-54-dependent Fis family transcriptional regulator [Deltaproteobacteria bacterium]|nr:sigma-54-dependent Fis family transcriptional regulator [Deltaproteobacteria bacterium]
MTEAMKQMEIPVRKPQILLVDDEVAMVRSLELLLRPLGDIHKSYSVPEAEEVLTNSPIKIDCIVTDVNMPEASGLTLLDYIKRKAPEIPVIVMTAYSSVPQAVEAMQRGAFEYIVKPFENADLVQTVKHAIHKKGLVIGETEKLPEGWICNSQAMMQFMLKAQKLAETDSTVLILGETGVGKSRAARWIHEMSPRSKKEFLSVDGRAHEEDSPLLSRSLAKVGTIFIAEVFSLGSRAQDRLIEVLTEAKVRVLASSSSAPDLQSPPDFRSDLFAALTALTTKVPSLRERKDDFDALVREILSQLAATLKLKKLGLESRAAEKLSAHSFPGNIKELERILERAALQAKAGVISEEAIQFEISDFHQLLPFSIPVEDGWNRVHVLRTTLERELILRALEKYPDCSNTEIAAILGTTRRILELRMKDYQIRETSS